MEGLVIAVVARLFGLRRLGRRRRRLRPNVPPRAPAPTPRRAQPTPPPPFDTRTALRLAEPVSISGAAFVIDGDSLVIRRLQIRLFGIDAPELDHPYGRKAKWTLVSLCKGRTIRAEVVERDAHGRTVARCYLPDGRDLSAEMVKCGLAIDWPKFSGGIYRALEHPEARRKLWLADARQKGRMHVWARFDAERAARAANR